ncbi:MAG: hypothetical protein DRQ45_08225 [Gammaproteobacteria bacterium]|nr:MAG: hypothetical protein DRQ45_08225 [Gammaproteobacteria bacterium]
MAIHNERRKLHYSAQQLFELIAQVERYPEFLPLWHQVKVSKNEQNDSGQRVYITDQLIQVGPFYKRFRTKTILEPFHRIHIVSSDPLFRQFSIDWLFLPGKKLPGKELPGKELSNQECCQIDFKLNCEASSVFLRPVFDIALMDTARSIVSAFEDRARSIYDH